MKLKNISYIIFTGLICIQFFWFYQENGNTLIYIQNHSLLNTGVDCSIIYEKENLGKLTFSGEEILPVKNYSFNDIGVKCLIVKSEKLGIVKKKTFFSLPVKWIIVDFYEDEIFIDIKYVPPLFY